MAGATPAGPAGTPAAAPGSVAAPAVPRAPEVVVIDYHKGNLLSVARGLDACGARARVTDDPAVIAAAAALVLPGVGAFADAMAYLRESGQDEAILSAVARGAAFLGICLGEHLVVGRGDEGADAWVSGLGILPGSVERLDGRRLKVPHVGWDQVFLTEVGLRCPLFSGVSQGANLYFTHSYALADDVPEALVCARTHYTRSFPCAVWQGNVFGVQFHPEKSSTTGRRILRNFVRVAGGEGLA